MPGHRTEVAVHVDLGQTIALPEPCIDSGRAVCAGHVNPDYRRHITDSATRSSRDDPVGVKCGRKRRWGGTAVSMAELL